MHEARRSAQPHALHGAFALWKAGARNRSLLSLSPGTIWTDVGTATDCAHACLRARAASTWWYRWIKKLQNIARPSLERDRKIFLDDLAESASKAMSSGDSKQGYAIARALGAPKVAGNSSLRRKDGTLTQSP